MKTLASMFISFVLTAAMLTGCGCPNRNAGVTTPTTAPTPGTTTPATTEETRNHGNGPLEEESSTPSDGGTETTEQSRSRNMPIK